MDAPEAQLHPGRIEKKKGASLIQSVHSQETDRGLIVELWQSCMAVVTVAIPAVQFYRVYCSNGQLSCLFRASMPHTGTPFDLVHVFNYLRENMLSFLVERSPFTLDISHQNALYMHGCSPGWRDAWRIVFAISIRLSILTYIDMLMNSVHCASV